ncbi:MAG: hypothetical protein GY943_05765 [Chloroflexi bacterium]|nr:hypothetical protein [Chloroflexota bacterium]
MLTENDVVNAIKKYLESKGYTVEQALATTQKGIDIIASHSQYGKCLIEAKGATSAREGSENYGNEFSYSQIKSHIGMAILKSFQTIQKYKDCEVAIALPNNKTHRAVIESICVPIASSGLRIYMVNEDESVEEYAK